MDDIPVKVLVVDSDEHAAGALADGLREIDVVLKVELRKSVPDASDALNTLDLNVVYIDPIGLGIDETRDFIFRTRRQHPSVVFVLYYDVELLKAQENNFYAGEGRRFLHYFILDKSKPGAEFARRIRDTVSDCQGDLSFNLTQEKIASLQKELVGIQESASDDYAIVPRPILQDILDLLRASKKEQSPGPQHPPAQFLGPIATSVAANRCFIIMPYSQDWSEAVETIVRQTCESSGFEVSMAKEMKGQFVLHDIWQGITGSAIILADLTGANANVAYEVGLADAIGREVILICQDTNVPFNFLGQRLIVYKNNVQGAIELREKLSEKLETIERPMNDS